MRSSTMVRPASTTRGAGRGHQPALPVWVAAIWIAFVIGSLLALDVVTTPTWSWAVPTVALVVLAAVAGIGPAWPWTARRTDPVDLAVIAGSYLAVVGLFRLAFVGFTQDNVLGLFLSFAAGLLLGVVGPVVYTVWIRKRPLRDLGLGLHHLRATLGLGLAFAAVQFAVTLWGYDLPAPVDWAPLLVMSLTVGLFESVFFRGFVQGRLEASFGTATGVVGGAVLYSLYHVGYGMGADELWFLFALGVVYAVAYRLVDNVLVLWPLLTPMGAFFNNLQAGDIQLPWASIAGFADVLSLMAAAVWLAHRHQRRRRTDAMATGP